MTKWPSCRPFQAAEDRANLSTMSPQIQYAKSGDTHLAYIGSGISFEDRGVDSLKGVPGEWGIYAVSA